MTGEDKLVELTRIYDPIEADLIAAFLEDDDLEFDMDQSEGAVVVAMMPPLTVPTIFLVHESDLERAKDLLEEYRKVQAASLPPDDAVDGED